jgi:kinesin family protein 2/24
MIIESDMSQNSEQSPFFDPHIYQPRDTLSEILSIEIPKTKVIVRKRPLNQKELSQKEVDNISIVDKNKVVITELKKKLDLTKYIDKKEFIFDRAYDEKSSNDLIYKEEIRPMIYNAFYQKAKVTCFAYGQTGSGKTYTLFGTTFSQNAKNQTFGLYALAGYDIFNIKNSEKKFNNFWVFVSFYEIYCDTLYDLLNNRAKLETREDYKHDINIVGLSENKINSLEELIKVVNYGSKQRTIGKTGANSESSRSHGIIQLRIYDTEKKAQHAKINFIDLAGSERESDKVNVDKKTRIDGAAINQSLLALKECIRALEMDQLHLPFRGSKLTLVLRDSFIGNCKTLMISTISPGYKTSEHTVNTLRYANRLKEIKSMGNIAKNFNKNNINFSKGNNNINNEVKNDPNQYIRNLLSNNANSINSNKNISVKGIIENNNKNNNDKNISRNISSESKNSNVENNLINILNNKKPRKRKNSNSSSNSPMKDIPRKSINDLNFKMKKNNLKFKANNPNANNNLKYIKLNPKQNNNIPQNNKNTNNSNTNNICTLTLMTSNSSENENFNAFNKNSQMNITQQINLHNTNLQTMQNNQNNANNQNISFNLFNENNNFLNLSQNSLLSFQSSNFNNLNLDELEKKNDMMVESIVNQEKSVVKKQQSHINSMCELLKNEISSFKKYQQEQTDISTYIDSMQNILKSQNNEFIDFNTQLEKLNYMIKQQIKLSNLIEQIKKNECSKLSISGNPLGNSMSLIEDQNAINLKNLQHIQSQINIINRDNNFDE